MDQSDKIKKITNFLFIEEIEELLEIKWRNWDEDKIKRNIKLLKNSLNIEALKGEI